MDRRGFLGRALGAVAAAATTKLWVPPVSTLVAEPERTVFLPPPNGWLTSPKGGFAVPGDLLDWEADTTALDYIRRFERTGTTYDIETFSPLPFTVQPGDTVKVVVGAHIGHMVVESLDCLYDDRGPSRMRLSGRGVESYLGAGQGWPAQPVGTITSADRMNVSRTTRPMHVGLVVAQGQYRW